LRINNLILVKGLKKDLEETQEQDEDDRELIMRLSSLYTRQGTSKAGRTTPGC